MPHVLIVVENLSVPFDRRVWQEALALRDAGYDVSVISPKGHGRDEESFAVLEGVRIHRYALAPARGGPAGYAREYGIAVGRSIQLAMRIHRRRRVDVVHLCNPPDLLFLVALPLKLRGARVVFDQHDLVPELFESRFGGRGMLWRGTRLLERATYGIADMVIATNESYRDVAIGRGRVRPDRVHVVRSAPDLARFTMAEPDPGLRADKPFLAAYIGVMGPQDGVDYALRALAHYRNVLGRDDLHAIFMGSGDAYDDCCALATELGIADMVEFPGRVPDDVVRRVLSTADVCLSPDPKNPLNDVSTMNKVVEYMAMGRPIVSFDLREAAVSARDAAVYVAGNDELGFAEAIAGLLDDPRRRERMGTTGRSRAEGPLSWDVSSRILVDAYRGLTT